MLRAFYYTALFEDQEYSPIRPLIDWLDYNGYTMVTKPTKEFTDAMGRRKIKGNMDIELAIDVMEMSEKVDHIMLFSGDGDFRRLVEAVQRKGVRVSVVSTIRSQPPMVADELRRQADHFLELQDLATEIGRAPQPPRPEGQARGFGHEYHGEEATCRRVDQIRNVTVIPTEVRRAVRRGRSGGESKPDPPFRSG